MLQRAIPALPRVGTLPWPSEGEASLDGARPLMGMLIAAQGCGCSEPREHHDHHCRIDLVECQCEPKGEHMGRGPKRRCLQYGSQGNSWRASRDFDTAPSSMIPDAAEVPYTATSRHCTSRSWPSTADAESKRTCAWLSARRRLALQARSMTRR